MTTTGQCLLCHETRELRRSHIIPKFVSDWQKASSATGYIRNAKAINVRFQDGDKERWLCDDCEGRLNVWETPTATHVFHPCNRRDPIPYEYGPWLLKFAISVSWRSMLWIQSMGHTQAD